MKFLLSVLMMFAMLSTSVFALSVSSSISSTYVGEAISASCNVVSAGQPVDVNTSLVFNGSVIASSNYSNLSWERNDSLVSGFVFPDTISSYAVGFNTTGDGTFVLISGGSSSTLHGYTWSGSSWVSNSTVVNGASASGTSGYPVLVKNIFGEQGTSSLITGGNTGTYTAYSWNGTGWVSNSSVVSGLPDVGAFSTGAVIYNLTGNGLWFFIAGENSAVTGYSWNGSSWVSNSSLVSGISLDALFKRRVSYAYDLFGNNKHTLFVNTGSGSTSRNLFSFNWNGSSWVSNSTQLNGINVSTNAGYGSSSLIFNISGNSRWHMLTNIANGSGDIPASYLLRDGIDAGTFSVYSGVAQGGTYSLYCGASDGLWQTASSTTVVTVGDAPQCGVTGQDVFGNFLGVFAVIVFLVGLVISVTGLSAGAGYDALIAGLSVLVVGLFLVILQVVLPCL